jgi:voltage-gated potassium channel
VVDAELAEYGRPLTDREKRAKRVQVRIEPWMIALGLVWIAAWAIEPTLRSGSAPSIALSIIEDAIWVNFLLEFTMRIIIAPQTGTYLKRHWWEVIILALPVLRFLRILRVFRMARSGRAIASAVSTSRSAERKLAGRLGMLAAASGITVLIGGRILFEYGDGRTYIDSIYAAALAAIANEPVKNINGVAATGVTAVAGLLLLVFSVVVIGAMAGTLGAYLVPKSVPEGSAAK